MIERRDLSQILVQYQALLSTVDAWFARCQAACGAQIQCAAGCAACCRGLFDVTLLDAFLLQAGFARLPSPARRAVQAKALARLAQLQADWPGFGQPYLLNHLPDELWTEMPEGDQTPCPLLGEDGNCLVYEHRPMICRTHGLPNIDDSGESFSDLCCTLNFVGTDPLQVRALRWPFRRAFECELELCVAFNRLVLGKPLAEADTFIPLALLIDFPALVKNSLSVGD